MSTAISQSPRVAMSSPAVLWSAWFASRIIGLGITYPSGSNEITYYFNAVTSGDAGTEYPALLLAVPWLLVNTIAPTLESFRSLFVVTALLFDALMAAYLIHAPHPSKPLVRRDKSRLWGAWFWILFGLLVAPVFYYRLDFLPGITVAAALAVLHRSGAAASALIAVATSLKLWPGLLAAGLLGKWNESVTRRNLIWFVGSLAGLAVGMLAAIGAENLVKPFTYQGDRGLQVESVFATPFVIRGYFRDDLYSVEYAPSKSFEIFGPGVEKAIGLSSIAMAVTLLVGVAWALRCLWRGQTAPQTTGLFFVTIILLLLVANKVFSPQYMVWLGPVVAVELAALWDKRSVVSSKTDLRNSKVLYLIAALILLATGFTTYVFPLNYHPIAYGLGSEWLPVAALAIRNLIIVVCAVLGVFELIRSQKNENSNGVPLAGADEQTQMDQPSTEENSFKEGSLFVSLARQNPDAPSLTTGVKWSWAFAIACAGSALRLVLLGLMTKSNGKGFVAALKSWDSSESVR